MSFVYLQLSYASDTLPKALRSADFSLEATRDPNKVRVDASLMDGDSFPHHYYLEVRWALSSSRKNTDSLYRTNLALCEHEINPAVISSYLDCATRYCTLISFSDVSKGLQGRSHGRGQSSSLDEPACGILIRT